MHKLDREHQAHQVRFCIKLVDSCAEAEAESHALRNRGLQLERRAQQVRAAFKSSKASKVSMTHNTEEVSAPSQRASPQRVLPCKQEPAQQMHKPLSIMSQLPDEQPQETQQAQEQCLPSEDAVRLDLQQQQAKASVTTAGSVQHPAASAEAQAAAAQQEEQTPLATAEAAAREEVQGVVAQHEVIAQSSVLQGMVVWGNFKGWPAWPGLVTTEEEMDVAEVIGKRGQLLQGV